jgi:hypothetical protein
MQQQLYELSKGDIVVLCGWRGSLISSKAGNMNKKDVRLISRIGKIVIPEEDIEHRVLFSNCGQWEKGDIRSLIDVPDRCFWEEVTKISEAEIEKYVLLLSV